MRLHHSPDLFWGDGWRTAIIRHFRFRYATLLHLPAHVSAFLAFMLLLLLTGIIAHIPAISLPLQFEVVMLGSINRLGGILIGAAEGALLLSMLFSTATAGFMPDTLKQKVHASESANMFAQTGDRILSVWRGRTGTQP